MRDQPRAGIPVAWSGEAFNPVPKSENRIHGDEVARVYGFRGGLVPGVVVSAYLGHPAAVAWGRDWLSRGRWHAVVHSPVYDKETFRVEVDPANAQAYEARLLDPRDTVCATAEVELSRDAPEPPFRRGDPEPATAWKRPAASLAAFDRLRERGLFALRTRWSEKAEIRHYLRSPTEVAPVFREEGLASPAFVLGLTNWVLAANVRLDAWLHLETHAQHHRVIEPDTELIVEAAIADLFEKKGHHFVDLEVVAFDAASDAAVASVRLRAIHQLRAR